MKSLDSNASITLADGLPFFLLSMMIGKSNLSVNQTGGYLKLLDWPILGNLGSKVLISD